jgi:hypothetical protein
MLKTAIKVLSALLALVQGWQQRRELKEQQRAADELADNPVDWYNDHFDGVRDDKAGDADEADTDGDTKR